MKVFSLSSRGGISPATYMVFMAATIIAALLLIQGVLYQAIALGNGAR